VNLPCNWGSVELDFNFHHLIALFSGNRIYPLLLNSFKHCYINLAGQFFIDSAVVPEVFSFHKEMVKAFEEKDDGTATQIMRRMLGHGAEQLKRLKVKG
jgi:DNA-binding FadR family transcriptional regulator